jgi:serine/threonine-protein kinase
MRDAPPPALVELLGRLGLAAPAQVLAVQGRVKRLARGLPSLEQVWVDALAQARILTPFQAGEINAGRAESLVVGPYVLVQPLDALGYAVSYRARELTSDREVRLSVTSAPVELQDTWTQRLTDVVRHATMLRDTAIDAIATFGFHSGRLWTSANYVFGQSTSEWLLHHGRLPPAAVLEIARQMIDALCACETAGLVHGDISARQVWLAGQGQVRLNGAGLRGVVRPNEGYAQSDLSPETYDYLAPERIAEGTPPTVASDLYACGALWWHLLAGRPPIAGAKGLAKMQNAQTAKIADIAHLAPETPTEFADVLRRCLDRDPKRRPISHSEVRAMLGPSTLQGQRNLARLLDGSKACRLRLGQAPEARSLRGRARRATAIAVGCTLVLVAGTWPQWQSRFSKSLSQASQEKAAASTVATESVASTDQLDATSALSSPAKQVSPKRAPGPWAGSVWEGEDLVLAGDAPIEISDVPLRKGQVIRAPAGKRASVRVPHDGWRIDAEDVRIHDVDFYATVTDTPAIVTVASRRAEFRGCSWQGSIDSTNTAAVAWIEPLESPDDNQMLLCGELRLSDCLVQRVTAGLRRTARGSVLIELANVLHLGPGSLVELTEAPRADDSLELIVTHVTLRDASSLVACRYDALPAEPGSLIISAKDCALIPSADGCVVQFVGAAHPGGLLQLLEWTGHGSVVAEHAPLAMWVDGDGIAHAAADEAVQVAGLVRSDVGFAGDKSQGPSASRIVRWQVPLQSPEPPGIRESRPLPPGVLR